MMTSLFDACLALPCMPYICFSIDIYICIYLPRYNNPKGGETALHAACKCTHSDAPKVVSMLLDAGAVTDVLNLPVRDDVIDSMIYGYASALHSLIFFLYLLYYSSTQEFNTPLHFAASKGNLDSVKLLVERPEGNELINKGNAFGNTPLHEAAVGGQEAVINYLIEKGANVNAVNKRGSTPLLFSLYGDQPTRSLVSTFLDHGANISHADEDGVGVLHISAIKGHEDLVKFFLEKGVANTPDLNGHGAAFYARIKGHTGLVKLLGGNE